ncbi:unnamed protein product [Allacma fusca]|uniref:Cytochrome P450 n=1 Tax=Allacma fusca TaxID=39272 RepID=A0A8J2PM42_9HEXA|nr:unnamed protein product [Allacma fusca]
MENRIHEEIEEVLEMFKAQEGKPLKMKDFFHVSILNATWSLFMGQRFERGNEKLKHLAEAIHEFCTIDGFLVQLAMLVPAISKYIPVYSGFQRQLDGLVANYKFMEEAYNETLPPGHVQGQPRNFKEAWMDQVELIGDDKTSSFHPSQNCYPKTAGDVFMSSMESVSTTLEWTLLYMCCVPEVQKKLQAEIDQMIGTTRSPLLIDRPRMTYMDAVTSELLRFSTITPMNGPWRRATEDGEYKGYTIPRNTFLVANTYALHHDPEVWGDPENFRPERFLTSDGKIDKNVSSQVLAFSTGKRHCIGENLARDQLFLYIVSILQKFTVTCTNENPSLVGSPGMVRYPQAFELIFTSRFND